MAQSTPVIEEQTLLPLRIDVRSINLGDDEFYRLCRDNRELRLELTAQGELLIMSPTGSETGRKNAKLNYRLVAWAVVDGTGECFDSSTGFTLPNGAKRSPDASWIRRERWEALSEEQREKFAPICPDFVVELRSPDDTLSALQEKMQEYIENGAELGLLLDPFDRAVYIYRPGEGVVHLEDPQSVDGDPVLRGFTLKLSDIW
jgi:Uma2 family endonuclease